MFRFNKYLYSILVLARTAEECARKVAWLYDLLVSLGFLINHRKSELIPTQHFTYLGLAWNTVDLTVSLTEERVLKIRKKAQLVFDSQVVTCRQAAALEGSIISAMDAVPYARAKGRRLQQALSAIDLSDNDYSKILVVTEKIRNEARFWTVLAFDWFRQIKEPVATQVITTDTVPGVLGVELEGETAAAEVPSQYKEESINVHELLALHFGLHKFKDRLHRIILWQVDNEAARWSILNQGSSKSKVLNDLSLEILDFCQEIDVQVIPRRIESEANLVADSVSRGKRSGRRGVQSLRNTHDRHDGHQRLQEGREVLGLEERSMGRRDRLALSPDMLERSWSPVRVPSSPVARESTEQDQTFPSEESDSDSTVVAVENMVSESAEHVTADQEDCDEEEDGHQPGRSRGSDPGKESETSRLHGFWSTRPRLRQDLTPSATSLIQSSWRRGTEVNYGTY